MRGALFSGHSKREDTENGPSTGFYSLKVLSLDPKVFTGLRVFEAVLAKGFELRVGVGCLKTWMEGRLT